MISPIREDVMRTCVDIMSTGYYVELTTSTMRRIGLGDIGIHRPMHQPRGWNDDPYQPYLTSPGAVEAFVRELEPRTTGKLGYLAVRAAEGVTVLRIFRTEG